MPSVIPDVAHRRYNPLNGSWILLAHPHKSKRPKQGQKERIPSDDKPVYDPKCYLCPGNTRANGMRNPNYKRTFLFENDYSTVRMDEVLLQTSEDTDESDGLDDAKTRSSMFKSEPVIGRCYVLTYSANHHYTMSDMSLPDVRNVVEVWTSVYAAYLSADNPLSRLGTSQNEQQHDVPVLADELHGKNSGGLLRYMHIFDNNGEIVGCSNIHPHAQIWITSSLPDEPKREFEQLVKYRASHCGSHLLRDYLRLELDEKRKRERVVWENEGFAVLCPWWAVWAFEVLLLPKRPIRGLVELTEVEKTQFAEAILHITKAYDNLFGVTFPYISALHQAPLSGSEDQINSSYLHMHFSPPLLQPSIKKFFGGYELYGEPTREMTPEAAAVLLRRSMNEVCMGINGCGKSAAASPLH